MVESFGKNIVGAYTGGNTVKEIYKNGVLVWPVGDYIYYDYIQGRAPKYNEEDKLLEPPTIILNIPYVSGGLVIEASIKALHLETTSPHFPIRIVGHYTDTDYNINDFRSNNSGYTTFSDGFCRGNHGTYSFTNGNIYTAKITIPDDSYDSQLYINNTLYTDALSYEKEHHTNPNSIEIRILYSSLKIRPCQHSLIYFRIKDSNNNLLYDYKPALRTADGEPGLYETINDTFHIKEPKYNESSAGVLDFLYGKL